MEFPPDKEQCSFLGLLNFLNRYSANLVELSKSLHNLCALHADYKVSTKHMEAFQAIKSIFSLKIILPYYDCTAHMILQTDNAKKGLGSVLMQHENPSILPPHHSPRQREITRIWKEKHFPPFGEWNISITFYMERNSP